MFKPKSQKDQSQQPFYLSWFAGQGENLKRGGTAPHQSRKEKFQFKSPYQQPLTTIVHNVPNPYTKAISQPRTYQNNIQQISKIYAGPMLKRKSLEKTDMRGSHKQPRTFTQQHQRNQNFSEGRPQTQQMNTLDPKLYEIQQDPQPPQDDEDFEIMEIDNNDNFSNQSSEAESDEHQNLQLPTQQPEEVEMHKNKSFVQKQKEEPIASMRKQTASLNRPQTSEGGRRKRFVNSADSEQQAAPEKIQPKIIEEDEFENLEIIPIVSPVEMRSGFRRKQTDQVDDVNERPPSRHKTPPKATDLELPLQNVNSEINRDIIEIPIKNMYAQIEDKTDDFDDFDLNFFKMNNKVNLKKFQQKEGGYHTDDGKKQHSGQKHPHSANLKQLGFQNMSYSPLNTQITSAHGFRSNEGQIVIKYNTSSALHKNQSNQPVKVPFQTSLGQDFLRLFANDCID